MTDPTPTEYVLPSETDAEQQIADLHAWIATHANGGEGIVASILPGVGSTPMVSSKRHVMERCEPLVRRTVAATKGRGGGDEVVSVRLVTFRRVQDS